MTDYDPSVQLAFMHIPKTSGSALTQALIRTIKPGSFRGGYDRVLFGIFTAFESIRDEIRQNIFLNWEDIPFEADLIAGHFAFSTLQARYPNQQYMTFLREPHSRVLSHWLFWRTHGDEEIARWGEWGTNYVGLAHQPLALFLANATLACQIDNLCTRMLLWPHPDIPDSGFIDERVDEVLISAALARLQQLQYVDVVENPDWMTGLGRWLGREGVVERVNETLPCTGAHTTRMRDELTRETRALLHARGRLDLALWKVVAQHRVPSQRPDVLRECVLAKNIERFARLMRGATEPSLKPASRI